MGLDLVFIDVSCYWWIRSQMRGLLVLECLIANVQEIRVMPNDGPLHNSWWTLGILNEVLGTLWKGLWRLYVPEKIKIFWWQIGHNMVPIGEWLGKCGCSIASPLCSSPIETLRHCLSDCPQAQRVWDKVTHLLLACEVEGITSWSATPWIVDTFNADTWCYQCTRGKLIKTWFERVLKTASPRFWEIWMLIASFTLWYVWKTCCLKVFQYLPYGMPPRGIDHGYMVHDYSLPTRAIGWGLRPLQQRIHCPLTLPFWHKWWNVLMMMQGGNGLR